MPLIMPSATMARYPKVSLGHWPPLLYVLHAAWFAVAGVGVNAARIFSGLILLLLAAAVFHRCRALYGAPGAACAAAATVASPLVFQSAWLIMSDLLLAALPTLTGRFRIYSRRWYWSSGAVILLLGVPFYWYADGIGLGYPAPRRFLWRTAGAGLPVSRNEWGVFEACPWVLAAAALIGIALAFRDRQTDGGRLLRRLAAPFVLSASLIPMHLVFNLSWDPRLYLPCIAPMSLAGGYGVAWL